MGFYATPPGVVELVRSHLKFASRDVNAFDPCCGEGAALESVCKDTGAATYGVELDAARASQSAKRLDHAVHAAYEDVETAPESFGLLWLNPPYDDGEDARKELIFLRDTIGALASGGTLVYVIPQKRLTPGVARCLAANVSRAEVFRFPPPDFDAFGQIVVLAEKASWPRENEDVRERLTAAATDEKLAVLVKSPWPRYSVPSTGRAILEVRANTPEDLARMSRSSPIWARVDDLTAPPTTDRLGQPPTPLHVGHLGLLLASGLLNGTIGEGEDKHLVVGKPVKHIVETVEVEDDGETENEVARRLETFRVTIKVLRPDGDLARLE